MAIQMKALKSFPYAGKRVRVGDIFNARGTRDAKVLKAIGNAEMYREPVRDMPKIALPIHIIPPVEEALTAESNDAEVEHAEVVQESAAASVQVGDDGLDGMNFEALHALAEQLGVNVHHRAGAQKVRQAIRDFKAAK